MEQLIIDNINSGVYKLIQKRKGKSPIWLTLAEIQKDDGSVVNGYVCCRTCKRLLKYNGKQTSNLVRHKCVTNAQNTINLVQVDENEKQKALELCSKWVVTDCRPFSAVDGVGFKNMIEFFIQIGAKYGAMVDVVNLIPHSTSISKELHSLAKQKKIEYKHKFKQIVNEGKAAVTTDLWTDNYVKRTFICATLHYEENSKMKEVVLGIKSMDFMRSTSENIKNKLQDILSEFGIYNMDKITFVTDRGANIKSALKEYCSINCSSHLLSNVLDSGFDSTSELHSTISASKKLVKYFKKANLQHLLRTSLKNFCPTRWSSHLNLFKSIYDNYEQINEILTNTNEISRILQIDLNILKALVELCEDFETVSKKLQTTSSPSLCFVLPSITRLKKVCEETPRDVPALTVLKNKILKNINEKWVPNLHNYHKLALFLYPPANQLQQNVIEMCINEVSSAQSTVYVDNNDLPNTLPSTSTSTTTSSSTSSSTPSNATINGQSSKEAEFFFSDLLRASASSQPLSLRSEVEKYSKEKVSFDGTFDLFQWWYNHKQEYPLLSQFALHLQSIPASSAASERVFSLAGNVIVEKRNRLAPKSVDNILFLNSIYKQEK